MSPKVTIPAHRHKDSTGHWTTTVPAVTVDVVPDPVIPPVDPPPVVIPPVPVPPAVVATISHITQTPGAGVTVVEWDVAPNSQGQVEHGATTAYGTLTGREASYTYGHHRQEIPATSLHFRVLAAAPGQTVDTKSADQTVAAAPPPIVTPPPPSTTFGPYPFSGTTTDPWVIHDSGNGSWGRAQGGALVLHCVGGAYDGFVRATQPQVSIRDGVMSGRVMFPSLAVKGASWVLRNRGDYPGPHWGYHLGVDVAPASPLPNTTHIGVKNGSDTSGNPSGTWTVIKQVPFTVVAGQWYYWRFEVVGAVVRGYVGANPFSGTWSLTATDGTLTAAGSAEVFNGDHGFLSNTSDIQFDDILIESYDGVVITPTPPTPGTPPANLVMFPDAPTMQSDQAGAIAAFIRAQASAGKTAGFVDGGVYRTEARMFLDGIVASLYAKVPATFKRTDDSIHNSMVRAYGSSLTVDGIETVGTATEARILAARYSRENDHGWEIGGKGDHVFHRSPSRNIYGDGVYLCRSNDADNSEAVVPTSFYVDDSHASTIGRDAWTIITCLKFTALRCSVDFAQLCGINAEPNRSADRVQNVLIEDFAFTRIQDAYGIQISPGSSHDVVAKNVKIHRVHGDNGDRALYVAKEQGPPHQDVEVTGYRVDQPGRGNVFNVSNWRQSDNDGLSLPASGNV